MEWNLSLTSSYEFFSGCRNTRHQRALNPRTGTKTSKSKTKSKRSGAFFVISNFTFKTTNFAFFSVAFSQCFQGKKIRLTITMMLHKDDTLYEGEILMILEG